MLAAGKRHYLVGFENNIKNATGNRFNFVLSNGLRSTQKDENCLTSYDFILPAHTTTSIRRVIIHFCSYSIGGFSFLDKDGATLFEIGATWLGFNAETVLLEENEVIVGVVAKLWEGWQSVYTDF